MVKHVQDEDDELYEALTRAQTAASEKTKTRFSDLAKGLQQKDQPTELRNPIDKSVRPKVENKISDC